MKTITELLKALSDETRLRIILLLNQSELCVCQLCGIMSLSQPKISKHLSKLRDLGLVQDRREDKYVYYSLNGSHKELANFIGQLEKLAEGTDPHEQDLKRLQDKMTYLTQCGVTPLKF